ncbi:MAG TPA: NAD-dependent epimerase/dehydratase family protein [Anaerolineales bacterium]|nr:NAD-dependent epimerase/dehydratase family protein [Anaerolineales bacterium]
MANFLVAGAAGFIAYHVVEMLLEQGHAVLGLDNLNQAYDVRMKEHRLGLLQRHPGFTFQRLDISDNAQLQGIFKGALADAQYAAVINLAARAGVRQSVENPWVYLETNTTGTLNLLELCRHRNIPKFILASTSSVYGADAPLPTPETASTDRPLQTYAASKLGAEALSHVYHYLYGLDVSVVRYFTVYGPVGRPDMSIFRFTKWISEGLPLRLNGDGQQTRGFTFVEDIARGTLLALKPLGYEIINLGGHESIKIIDLIHLLEAKIGRQAIIRTQPAHPADMLASWADVSKAGRLLGWEPRVSMAEGLDRMVAWYSANQGWASQIDTG